VADRGEGIRKGDLRKVFRRFYRAPGSGEKNTSGVGLGLALCKHVAEGHGGWIEAESEAGRGTTFSVYVPAGG
jgi:signal transduction histidine kinase